MKKLFFFVLIRRNGDIIGLSISLHVRPNAMPRHTILDAEGISVIYFGGDSDIIFCISFTIGLNK